MQWFMDVMTGSGVFSILNSHGFFQDRKTSAEVLRQELLRSSPIRLHGMTSNPDG